MYVGEVEAEQVAPKNVYDDYVVDSESYLWMALHDNSDESIQQAVRNMCLRS